MIGCKSREICDFRCADGIARRKGVYVERIHSASTFPDGQRVQDDAGGPAKLAEVDAAPVELLQRGLEGEVRLELHAHRGAGSERDLDSGDELLAVAREQAMFVAPVRDFDAAAPAQRECMRQRLCAREREAVPFDGLAAKVAVVAAEVDGSDDSCAVDVHETSSSRS